MAEIKTQKTKASVAAFLNGIADPVQRKDAKALAALIRKATGKKPAMWGTSIVGFGDATYTGAGGRKVDWFTVGFSPRKAALTVYLMGGLSRHGGLLEELGPHRVGGGCLYVRRLDDVDGRVLSRLVAGAHENNAGAARDATLRRRVSGRGRRK